MIAYLNNIVAILIAFIVISSIAIKNKKMKKILEKQKFWVIFNTIWLIYYISARYIPYIVQSATSLKGGVANNMLIQNIFLTNICPAACMTITIGSYFRRFREQFGASIAVIGILGGSLNLTALFLAPVSGNLFVTLFFKTVIYYENPYEKMYNYLMFVLHLLLIVQGMFLLILSEKYTKRNLLYTHIWMASYISYVGIIMLISGVRSDVGGLWINDWSKVGNYKGVFYPIGAIYWPGKTHGITSVAKTLAGISILIAALWGVIGVTVLVKNKKQLIKEKIKKRRSKHG